jgi:hypothetical protein
MLQRLEEEIRHCYERAANCRQRADITADPQLKADLLMMELSWIRLAKSFEFSQSLERFLSDGGKPPKLPSETRNPA